MKKNIIYTGNYSINWSYFKGMQGWKIENLYHMKKYCNRHNIEFRVIDNTYPRMDHLFNWLRKNSDNKADAWNIGTLSSIIAHYDFLEEDKYENFCWLDLDTCITKPDVNLFDYIKDDLCIDYKDGFRENYKKNKFLRFFELENNHFCNTCFFMMTKNGSLKFDKVCKNLGIDLKNQEFLKSMIEYFRGDNHFMSDECIVEAAINTGELSIHSVRKDMDIVTIKPHDPKIYKKGPFLYHFPSQAKLFVEDFWEWFKNADA